MARSSTASTSHSATRQGSRIAQRFLLVFPFVDELLAVIIGEVMGPAALPDLLARIEGKDPVARLNIIQLVARFDDRAHAAALYRLLLPFADRNCVAGGGYLPVLCDKILMTEGSQLCLAGPALVKAAVGQPVAPEELGGAARYVIRGGECPWCRLVREEPRARERRGRRVEPARSAARTLPWLSGNF